MDKRYQVFLSSTFADLQDERQGVFKALMQMDCIPAGMELFPAADEEQLAFIKKVIDDCDYYVLIVGGRYGSVTADGFSFTEREYDYAISKGIKVLAFLHGNPGQILSGKTDSDAALRAKLEAFKAKIQSGRIVKYWNTASELPGLVALSLLQTIKTYPAVGWVRANRIASDTILGEVNELRKANAELVDQVAKLKSHEDSGVLNLAGMDESITIRLKWSESSGRHNYKEHQDVKATWAQMFTELAPHLLGQPSDGSVRFHLATGLYQQFKGPTERTINMDERQFETIGIQLMALGLVNRKNLPVVGGGQSIFWSLTERGQRMMLELRTVKASQAVAKPDRPEA